MIQQFKTEKAEAKNSIMMQSKEIAKLANKIDQLVDEKAICERTIKKLQKDAKRYKEMYENPASELHETKRTLNDMNSMWERVTRFKTACSKKKQLQK